MRIDYKNKIVFLANTKVASTSLELALDALGVKMGRIDGLPRIRHLNFSEFLRIRHVMRASNFKTICVVRHPIEKAKSWYKFRSRDDLDGNPQSTKGIPLETFLKEMQEKDFDDRFFCHDVESGNSVDLIFKYENLEIMIDFLQKIYGDSFQLEHKNKSPQLLLDDVSSDTVKRFQDAVDWYDSIPPVPDFSDINLYWHRQGNGVKIDLPRTDPVRRLFCARNYSIGQKRQRGFGDRWWRSFYGGKGEKG